MIKCTCVLCGYVWEPHRNSFPKYCPFCGTTSWNNKKLRKQKNMRMTYKEGRSRHETELDLGV